MARLPKLITGTTTSTTRASSADSSAFSNIDVSGGAQDAEDASDRLTASTPPTSAGDCASLRDSLTGAHKLSVVEEEPEPDPSTRRLRRARAGVETYNVKKLADAQFPLITNSKTTSAAGSRNVSGLTGRTLVGEEGAEGESESKDIKTGAGFEKKVEEALDLGWELPAESTAQGSGLNRAGKVQRRSSVRDRVKKVAGRMGSVLGKRGRGVLDAGWKRMGRKAQAHDVEEEEQEPEIAEEELPRWKKELDMGAKGLLDEMDLDADLPPPPPTKKARLCGLREISQPPAATSTLLDQANVAGRKMKTWQREGLYVGQSASFDPTKLGGGNKLQKKRPRSATSDTIFDPSATVSRRPAISLPMFSYLDKTRDFTIPYDVFAPSFKKGDEKPKDWHQLNRNRLVGEARELWERSEKLPASMCVCAFPTLGSGEQGCDDQCLNRVMQYECNDDNCNLSSSQCSNRAFAELATRVKHGGPYDVGVEVLKTADRGFGVRSCRTFAPGQIIMEYTGEIISEAECQRRMREDYKDKQCYYLMELERGLVIDGTKGSMARFINHSCAPNCEVRMLKVNGTPRMGVFAGEEGVVTGEELTYDYNFDNFGATRQVCYCGASTCRGFLTGRLNATELKKAAKMEGEKKRKAAEEARRHAEEEERKKQSVKGRGSNWRGWVAVDDPETKEKLRREKMEKEEAEKNSERAKRMAARRVSLPAPAAAKLVERRDSKRRKTVILQLEDVGTKISMESTAAGAEAESIADSPAALASPLHPPAERQPQPEAEVPAIRTARSLTRAPSSASGSKFTEELDLFPRPRSAWRPGTAATVSTITTTTTRNTRVSVSETRRSQDTAVVGVAGVDGPDDEAAAAADGGEATEAEEKEKKKRRRKSVVQAAKEMGKAVTGSLKRGGSVKSLVGCGNGESGAGGLRQSRLSFGRP